MTGSVFPYLPCITCSAFDFLLPFFFFPLLLFFMAMLLMVFTLFERSSFYKEKVASS